MNCQEAQQQILQWEDIEAELRAHPDVASHVAVCADCQKLIAQLKTLESAARAMPLPEGYAQVPPEFLRRIEREAARPKGSFGLFARRAIAAVLIIGVGIMAIVLATMNTAKARADVVYGQLVDWNLQIGSAKDTTERTKIYNDGAAAMNQKVSALSADDQPLAKTLMDTARELTTENDPLADEQTFVKIAEEIKARAAAAHDSQTSQALENVYEHVLHDGVEAKAHLLNPATLTPEKKIQYDNVQKHIEGLTVPAGVVPTAPTKPAAQLSVPAGPAYVYAGSAPRHRFGRLPVYSQAPSGVSSSAFAHSWTGGAIISSGGASSYAGSDQIYVRSGGSSNVAAPRTAGSSPQNQRIADSSTNAAKCDPTDPMSPAAKNSRDDAKPPFPGMNDDTSAKIPTGDQLSNSAGTKDMPIPGMPKAYTSGPSYDKPTVSRPSIKDPDSESTPAITAPSSDAVAACDPTLAAPTIDLSLSDAGKSDDDDFTKPLHHHHSKDASGDSGKQFSDKDFADKLWQKSVSDDANKSDDEKTDRLGYSWNEEEKDKQKDASPAPPIDDGSELMKPEITMSDAPAFMPTQASPEPATAFLLAAGAALLLRRRR